MKLGTADIPKLQFSLLAVLLMIAIGAGCVFLSLKSNNAAKLERDVVQKERNEIDGKLKRVSQEETEIRKKTALFYKLQVRGIVGEEQRLEWIELLKEIRDKRRLIDLRYEVAPQRALDANPGNGFSFFASNMIVQLKLLHEEDLMRLLDDLRQQARALIQVKSCHVTRLPRGGAESGTIAQLQAECQIDWITLREAASK